MPLVEYGPWSPDLPDLGNPCLVARDVRPTVGGYGPFASENAISNSLGASPLGLAHLDDYVLAATNSEIFRLSGGTWGSISPNTYTASQWHFALYGSRIIAADGAGTPQKFDIGVDSVFADLAAAPAFNFPIIIRETLVGLGTPSDPQKVVFSATSDSDKWSADCGGGSQPLVDGGAIMGGVGGEYGVIFQRNAVVRMNFVGGDERFTFDTVENASGALSSRSIVPYKSGAFYLSEGGFEFFDGNGSRSISDGKVTRTFFDTLTAGQEDQVHGVYDPVRREVIWSFPVSGGRKMYIYSIPAQKFSEVDLDTELLALVNGSLAGFNGQVLQDFSGANLNGVVSSGFVGGERKTRLKRVKPMTDGAYTCKIYTKNLLSDTAQAHTPTVNAAGYAHPRTDSFYHRFETSLTGSWDEISGIEVEAVLGGRQG